MSNATQTTDRWIRVTFTNAHGFPQTVDHRINTVDQVRHARILLAKYDQTAARVWRGEPGYPRSYESSATFR